MRSVNQNHHLYVATEVVNADEINGNNVADGAIAVVGNSPLNAMPAEKEFYFLYKGLDGVTRSDFIPVTQVTYLRQIYAASQTTRLRSAVVTLKDNPVVGQDYVLNISFQQFYGLSPEDNYVKTVAVHVTNEIANPSSGTAKAAFYAAMVDALKLSFSREVGADTENNPYLEFTSDANGLTLTEKEQDWKLGKWEVENLVFDVFCSTITVNNDEVVWGDVEYQTQSAANGIPNSKKMADLEWFTFGERADVYRGMGYPNNFDFRPLVNPNSENGYDAIEIHFAYQGSCEDIQKSEKDITIICEAGDKSITDSLFSAIMQCME